MTYTKFKMKIKRLFPDLARAKERGKIGMNQTKKINLKLLERSQRKFDKDCNLTGGGPQPKRPLEITGSDLEEEETPGGQENFEFEGSGLSLPTGSSPLGTASSNNMECDEFEISVSSPKY